MPGAGSDRLENRAQKAVGFLAGVSLVQIPCGTQTQTGSGLDQQHVPCADPRGNPQ